MVNSEWAYKESLCYIRQLKAKYEGIMSSFCVFGGNYELFKTIKELKNQIYNLNYENWKRDKIWEYLNNDITLNELCKFLQLDNIKKL